MTTKTFDGQTAKFLATVATCMPPLSGDVMQGWIDNPSALKGFLGGLNPPKGETADPSTGIFRLAVDYSQSLEQMIAAGRYDWVNSDITPKRFPIEKGTKIVECEARYFHFDRNISSDDAKKEIESADRENPWMAAMIAHLLAHGAAFPEEQRKFPIVALRSVAGVRGDRGVPGLFRDDSKRDLYLAWWYGGWGPVCRFLAVRKVSAA